MNIEEAARVAIDTIPQINIRSGVAERYYARYINGCTDDDARAFIAQYGGQISMPCGATVTAEAPVDLPCPNSGRCAADHKECWVVKRTPA